MSLFRLTALRPKNLAGSSGRCDRSPSWGRPRHRRAPRGFSKADCELIYSGRYSPNMLAAAVAVPRDVRVEAGVKRG